MASKRELLSEIFEIESVKNRLAKTSLTINIDELLEVISRKFYSLEDDMSVSYSSVSRAIKYLWPDKKSSNKLCTYLLNKYGYKFCANCNTVKEHIDFSKNKSRTDGLNNHCKVCCLDTRRDYQKSYQASRRADKLNRTPSWGPLVRIQVKPPQKI